MRRVAALVLVALLLAGCGADIALLTVGMVLGPAIGLGFRLIGLLMNIIGDFTYTLVDPRLDFERRAT